LIAEVPVLVISILAVAPAPHELVTTYLQVAVCAAAQGLTAKPALNSAAKP
jgi:hypothetical protein